MAVSEATIRAAREGDIPGILPLLSQLGYPLDAAEVRRRYMAVAQASGHAIMIAETAGCLVAFCHVYARPALDKPPEAVVQALVVDDAARGTGIGRQMMVAAEAWSKAHGFASVALASHVSRTSSHAFYEALGYRIEATSHLFRKILGIQ